MKILYFMLPVSLMLGLGFLCAFLWSAFKGHYDDLETPAHRMLLDDEVKPQR